MIIFPHPTQTCINLLEHVRPSKREWIEIDLDFQKYAFANVKINPFQIKCTIRLYSFIGIV